MTTATQPQTAHSLRAITYHVPSETDTDVLYDVTVTDAGWSCTCKAGKYPKTRGHCWHLKAARSGLHVGKPRIRAMLLPRPAVAVDLWRAD